MQVTLLQHIQKHISITNDECEAVLGYFKQIDPAKKEVLLSEGDVCTHNYFVETGCLRMYYLNEKGVEHTVQFAIEHWWLADYISFQMQKPSGFFIQAVERSTVMSLSWRQQEKLLADHPVMERYFRLVHQRAHGASQVRLKAVSDSSREDLYFSFARQFPEFVQRVPQYLLASYLGFTPEYLSEIRKKVRS